MEIYEEKWWLEDTQREDVSSFIEGVRQCGKKESQHPADLLSLPQLFREYKYTEGRRFDEIFNTESILVTKMYRRIYTSWWCCENRVFGSELANCLFQQKD